MGDRVAGKLLGNMKSQNVVTYHLSPFEQKAFAGFFSKGIANLLRRFKGNFLYWAPPAVLCFSSMSWLEAEFERSQRKNPQDYANDV